MKNKKEILIKCPWLAAEEANAEVIKWLVKESEMVEIDQDIMVMLLNGVEFFLPSPVDGTVVSINAEPGDLIEPDQVLAVIELA